MYVPKEGGSPAEESIAKAPQKPLEEVTCFKCGCKGHYANKCPKGHLAFLSQSQNPAPQGGGNFRRSWDIFSDVEGEKESSFPMIIADVYFVPVILYLGIKYQLNIIFLITGCKIIKNMLTRRRGSDIYLATVSRHRWSRQITMKIDKI